MKKNNIFKNKILIFGFVFIIFGVFFFAGRAIAQTSLVEPVPLAPECENPLGCDLKWSSLNKLEGL